MAAPEFEWDAAKEHENVKKHAVGFQEALTVFADPLARIFDDLITRTMKYANS